MDKIEMYWVPVPPQQEVIEEMNKHISILDVEERLTYEKYRVDFKKIEFMTGRLLLKTLLAQRMGIQPKQVRFVKNEYGKLFLHPTHETSGLYFNLSHTDQMIVCVLSPWEKAGIDVERIGKDHFDVMSSVFVDEEAAFVQSQPTFQAKREAFYMLWTRKEAVMKAVGMGFSLSPKTFRVPFQRAQTGNDQYDFYTYSLPPDYLCSLAVAKRDGKTPPLCQLKQIDFEVLCADRPIFSS